MALFIRQNEDRSKLQERLSAELQERVKRQELRDTETDTVTDSAYLRDTKDSSPLAWVWILIGLIIAGTIGYFIYLSIS